jgi:exportin-2 (importin alpha re-exporter)
LQILTVKLNYNLFCYRAPLLQSLIGLFELPEDKSSLPDDHYIEVDDTPGYQAAYSQLAFANKNNHDPLHGIHHSLRFLGYDELLNPD